jgi:hypothetical protein
VTAWVIRVALPAGWLVLPIALGTAGAAVMGAVRLAAWAGSVPRRAWHRARVRYARWKHIRELEREWKR